MSLIELSVSRKGESPADALKSLSEACDELNINSFDVYGDYANEDSWLKKFENEVAAYFGKESALFLPSGTMAQCIALKVSEEAQGYSHDAIRSFVCHYSSHVILHENNGHKELLHLNPIMVGPDHNAMIQKPLLYSDVKPHLDSTVFKPFAMLLEVPHREIGGKCTPYEDIIKMSEHCRRSGIHFHMDGARVWEASGSLAYDITNSQSTADTAKNLANLFDSVYVSFYKGLGSITGAMLLGSTDFILKSRVWQRRFGGNLYSLMPYGVSSWKGFRENKDSFHSRRSILTDIVKQITDRYISNQSNPIIRFDPAIPEVSMIHIHLSADLVSCVNARDQTIQDIGISCFSRIRECTVGNTKGNCYFELNLGPTNGSIPIEQWIRGWDYLLNILATTSIEK